MTKFNRYHKIVYCIISSLGLIDNKNATLKRNKYACKVHDLHNVYMNAILDHHPNYPRSLKDIVTLYLCQFYQPGQEVNGGIFYSKHLALSACYKTKEQKS